MPKGESWSLIEIEAIVADYRHMLMLELSGQKYSKTVHRNNLLRKLDERTETAVERKHQNISAIMLDLGRPWIRGYKPFSNYQRALFDCVVAQVANDEPVERTIESAVNQPATVPMSIDFEQVVVDSPKIQEVRDEQPEYVVRERRAIKRNYLAEESHNRSLGIAGEKFVIEYERHRLIKAGESELSRRVEHVANLRGDGLGFDVLSFESDGSERYIEVKTTAFGKEAPFYVSDNELSFSIERKDAFYLYRLFDFRLSPKMFSLCGPISERCRLDPITFRASF